MAPIHYRFYILLAVVSATLILLFSYSFDLFQYGDNCGYMTLGISLSEGKGFKDCALPVPIHFLWWPPGFPLLIALFYKMFGSQWWALKVILFMLLYLSFLTYSLMLQKYEKKDCKSFLILLACCFSSGIHLLSSYLYSEIWYVIVTLFFFSLWQEWKDRLTMFKLIPLALLAIYISSVRLIGLSLSIALIIYLLLGSKDNRQYIYYSMLTTLLVGIVVTVFLFYPPLEVGSFRTSIGLDTAFKEGAVSSVIQQSNTFGYVWLRIVNMLLHFFQGYGLTLIPQALVRTIYDMYEMNVLKGLIMACITGPVTLGWLLTSKRYRLLNLYVMLYMSVLCVYGPLYVRLLVPIIPFLFFYLYTGLEKVFAVCIKKTSIARNMVLIIWAALVFDNGFLSFTDPHRTMPAQFGDTYYQNCVSWVVKNSQPRDVVVSQVHAYLFLLRGIYCLPYFGATSPNEIISYFETYSVKYCMISPFYRRSRFTFMRYVMMAEKEYPERFTRVFQENNSPSYVLEYHSPRDIHHNN